MGPAGDHMTDSLLPTLLELRLLVGFLGERAQFAWWPTVFYEPSSRRFLEPVYAKTSRAAQYHGVLEAARRLHDEHLSVGSYHLFRLPEEVEEDLYALVLGDMAEEVFGQATSEKDASLDTLQRLAATGRPASVGPIAIGSIKDLDSADALQAIAGGYFAAFSENTRTYPYLVA